MMLPTFAALLRDHMTTYGLSQGQLARRAAVDHSFVSRLLNGTRAPSRETVDLLGFALGLSRGDRNLLALSAGFVPPDLAETTLLLTRVPGSVRAQLTGLLRAMTTQDVNAA